ncbi:hypothetical protein ARMGADRAFT_1101898 [Armillaria gallica]|uniref:Uncharacterized protein n=1 Tax=Armillaria gallica TaxID=47427 RepID=A0A2H3E1X5_ARMGA|nr:hypothetical protein ARMGADRAFT_1101898 [Armillaria gallica]
MIFHYIDEGESLSMPCTCDTFMLDLAIPVSLPVVLQSEQLQRSERVFVLFNGHFPDFFEALMRAGSVLDIEGSGQDGGYNEPRSAGHDDAMVRRGISPGPSHSDLKAGLLLGRYSSVGEIRRTHYNNRLPLTTGTPIIIAAMWVYQVRGIVTYYDNVEDTPPRALYTLNIVNWAVLYASLILATLLWCTIFIIYRILRLGGVTAGMRVYHRVIEMLVESAALYSAVLVILLVLEVRNELAGGYLQEVAIAIRGIVHTVLVGRIAAGHARPDNSWSESTRASSLRFGNHSSSQNDGAGSGWDTSSRLRPDLEEGSEGSM